MKANEHEHAHDWFAKANADLTSAGLLVGVSEPPETICFLAQQGAEKYLNDIFKFGVTAPRLS